MHSRDPSDPDRARIHRFGVFELDADLFELRREGKAVAIQRKAFDILWCLVESRGVVTRADLMGKVWPGVVVTSDSLAQAVMAARTAIGDDGETPTFIHTVRGRGYRFAAPEDAPARTNATQAIGTRAASLAVLREALARARTGRGALCLITGEAGIGKTSLVEELCATSEGVEAIFVRCDEGEGTPDLWPFARALRDLQASGASLSDDLTALADGRVAAATLADPPARFALLDAAVRAFTGHRAGRPLLLVIDDLHLADAHSLRLLALISAQVRSAPLLVVAAYGPSKPRLSGFRAAMGALAKDSTTATIRLEPLARAEVAAFVQSATGRSVSEAIVDQALEKTKGNPLLLSQLVQVLGKQSELDRPPLATSALVGGDDMRDAITTMLSGLPESVDRVLTLAAVFGQTFAVAPLAAALAQSNEDVLLALDRAEVARVVARAGRAGYRFTYPLVRDVLYKRLPASACARLHGCVATALTAQVGERAEHAHLGEIAEHLVAAAAAGDVDAAIDGSLRAAELARTAGDHEAAARYALRGLEAFRFAQRPDEVRRARLGTFVAPR